MLLVDTGVFLSAADTDEPAHSRCAELLQQHRAAIVTTAPVAAETAWMIESRLGVEAESATMIATLNHRDFTVVRPSHTAGFELLPGPV